MTIHEIITRVLVGKTIILYKYNTTGTVIYRCSPSEIWSGYEKITPTTVQAIVLNVETGYENELFLFTDIGNVEVGLFTLIEVL